METTQENKLVPYWPHIRMSTTFALGEHSKDIEHPIPGTSKTVPDMAMSLTEILYRHSRGLPVHEKQALYSELELPDLRKLDLSEIQELKEQARNRVDFLRQELETAQLAERQTVHAEKQRQSGLPPKPDLPETPTATE